MKKIKICPVCNKPLTKTMIKYFNDGKYFQQLDKTIFPIHCTSCYKVKFNKKRFCTNSKNYLKYIWGFTENDIKSLNKCNSITLENLQKNMERKKVKEDLMNIKKNKNILIVMNIRKINTVGIRNNMMNIIKVEQLL